MADCTPGTFVEDIRNDDDPRNYRVDFSKIQQTLGFHASVPLEVGIREIVTAVREGKVDDWNDPVYSNVKTLQVEGLRILNFEHVNETEELAATRKFLSRAA